MYRAPERAPLSRTFVSLNSTSVTRVMYCLKIVDMFTFPDNDGPPDDATVLEEVEEKVNEVLAGYRGEDEAVRVIDFFKLRVRGGMAADVRRGMERALQAAWRSTASKDHFFALGLPLATSFKSRLHIVAMRN